MMLRALRPLAALAALALLTGAAPAKTDPDNPTCPAEPDFGPKTAMTLTPADRGGKRVLLAEGTIDASLPARLKGGKTHFCAFTRTENVVKTVVGVRVCPPKFFMFFSW
ncbi:MAG: hypothetical protein ACKO1N_01890, partial [Erythrobacter sp.]